MEGSMHPAAIYARTQLSVSLPKDLCSNSEPTVCYWEAGLWGGDGVMRAEPL